MKINKEWSPFIKRGFVDRYSNRIIGKLIGILFRSVEFDKESLINLNQYMEKGIVVFASFETSQTSLLIFISLLKKHGIKTPMIALGFVPYILQHLSNMLKNSFRYTIALFKRKKGEPAPDIESIAEILEEHSMVLSLLSKKVFFRRYVELKADTLSYLVDIQKRSEKPVYIFPKITFWNMNPERTKTLITSKPTGDRGFIGGLFTIIKSRTPAFVRISAPLNLREEIENSGSDDSIHVAGLLRSKLLDIFHHDKRTILGPIIKTRKEMMDKVLFHENIIGLIREMSAEENIPETALRKKAFRYFREIAADFSMNYVMVFEFVLRFIFRKVYDGIHYDDSFIRKMRDAAAKGPLIYLPCHRSHMDYLILSCVLYRNKIVSPHIVAGANLTFFPMGKLFRRSGAFFIRRSFKGKALYTAVLKQYIKTLINEGYSIEFFIEGGRTRTGKLVFPKMGILKYLIEAIEEGYNRDMMLVPLSINYERIMEESAYMKEHAGIKKEKETTSTLVKSRKLLKRKYGRVFLEFNEPVSFRELTKDIAESEDPTPFVAEHIIRKINDVVLVTPSSLVTAAILFSPSTGFTAESVHERIVTLHRYLMHTKAKMSHTLDDEATYDELTRYLFESFLDDNIINKNDDDLYSIRDDQRVRINFYKNRIIHFFIPVSFTSLAIMLLGNKKEIDRKEVYKNFNSLADFFRFEFIYPENMINREETADNMLSYLEERSLISLSAKKISVIEKNRNELRFYAEIIQDYLESYLIVCRAVNESATGEIEKKDLIQEIRKRGISMYRDGEIKLMESLSMSYYHNSIDSLVKLKGLNRSGEDEKKKTVGVDNKSIIERGMKLIEECLEVLS
jgi:glycerol-3-phosphate O-acyltransferase